MNEIVFLSVAFLGMMSFAATPAMTFSYGTDMTERHKQESPVKIFGSYAVPRVDDGMPASDTVATTRFMLTEMEEVSADAWNW